MRRRNLSLDASQRTAASARIFAAVERLPAFVTAKTVALFAALPDEPDTAEALARWRVRKRIVLPRVEGDTMRFYRYDPAVMHAGAFGIAEPGPAAEPCAPADIDFMAVPGVAFTPSGVRLGRGRGYYDRYLAQPGFRAFKAGICYAHQVVAELSAEPHDVAVDCIVHNETAYP